MEACSGSYFGDNNNDNTDDKYGHDKIKNGIFLQPKKISSSSIMTFGYESRRKST